MKTTLTLDEIYAPINEPLKRVPTLILETLNTPIPKMRGMVDHFFSKSASVRSRGVRSENTRIPAMKHWHFSMRSGRRHWRKTRRCVLLSIATTLIRRKLNRCFLIYLRHTRAIR